MEQGAIRVASEVHLPSLRLELVEQEDSGPFRRTHHVALPTITYLPPIARERSRGCFGLPGSHRDLDPLGVAVVTMPSLPLHIVSPGFRRRDLLVCHIDPAIFAEMSGVPGDPPTALLDACRDVRSPRVLEALARMLTELRGDEPGRDRILAGYGLVLIGELARHFSQVRARGAPARGTLAPWQLRRIDERVADEARARPNLAELAALCGVGRRHLMRSFKAARGMTVLDFVERATFVRASRLLSETDLPLKRLAAGLGYASQASFSAAFRRHGGDTPSAFRNRHRCAP